MVYRRPPVLGLSRNAAQALIFLGAPILLLHCCDYVAQSVEGSGQAMRNLDCVDLFAGAESVKNGFRSERMASVSLDVVLQGTDADITTVPGFLRSILMCLRLKEGSILSAGPPCSSFVFINSFTSGRRPWRPFGFPSKRPYVRTANMITCRLVLLWLICTVRCAFFVTEQPLSSCMRWFPYVTYVQKIIKKLQIPWLWVSTHMGAFGAPSLKPTQLFGTAPWMEGLKKMASKKLKAKLSARQKKSDKPMVRRTINKRTGKVQVTGAAGLRASQVYPVRYGRKMAKLHKNHTGANKDRQNPLRQALFGGGLDLTSQVYQGPYMWRHAALRDIKEFLQGEVKAGRYVPQFTEGLNL